MELLHQTVRRDISLFSVEAWEKGYKEWGYPVLFHYDGVRVNFYHTEQNFRYFKNIITKRIIDDDDLFNARNERFKKDVQMLRDMKNNPTASFEELSLCIGKVMAFYLFVVSDAFVTARPEAWESRNISEGILYECDEMIEMRLKILLQKQGLSAELSHVLQVCECEELSKRVFEYGEELQKRLTGYIIADSTLQRDELFEDFCKRCDYSLPLVIENATLPHELHGTVAYRGFVRGRVKIIDKKEDLSKIEEGDILVACMTNANYISGILKSSAIVTDEGGITCHAAIVCRELRKPCITGVKTATKILKDDDIVEVDAVRGVVRVLFS